MALAAQRAGYDVHVATRVTGRGAASRRRDSHCIRSTGGAAALNPFDLISVIGRCATCTASSSPIIAHHVALQPAVIGSLAARGLPVLRAECAGGARLRFHLAQPEGAAHGSVAARLMRVLLNAPNARRCWCRIRMTAPRFAALGVEADRVFLIPGSGVDTERLKPLPEPAGEVTAAFVGRLLDDKGVRTLIAAHEF